MQKSIYFILTFLTLASCGSEVKNSAPILESKPDFVELPFIGNPEYVAVMRDGQKVFDTIPHTVPPFSLMAHDSTIFTNVRVEGKVYVANFFFTSCGAVCPAMTEQMKRLQQNTKDIPELLFLSHTVDPKRDTIPKLLKYIADRDLDTSNWYFLYGEQQYVHDLGAEGYMVNAMEDEKADGGFLHSEHFVLIDRAGHIRGLYDGTKVKQVDRLEKDLRNLIQTYK
jgi:protein SCO1/2